MVYTKGHMKEMNNPILIDVELHLITDNSSEQEKRVIRKPPALF